MGLREEEGWLDLVVGGGVYRTHANKSVKSTERQRN